MGQADRCLNLLQSHGETLSTAESLTCGLVAATFAGVPGASRVLRGGLAAYSTEVKIGVLGLDSALVDRFGVISSECAEAMATQALRVFVSDWAVSSTGVAGPDSQEGHDVGTVFVAVAGPGVLRSEYLQLAGGRNDIRASTVHALIGLLESEIISTAARAEEARRRTR